MSMHYTRKRNRCIFWGVLFFTFIFISCNRNTDVKETTQDIAVSSSAVSGVEKKAHKFKTCFGDGKFIEYHERDIMIGEKKVNGNTFPIIYSINPEGIKEIIYENDDCGGIRNLAIETDWIYFIESSIKEKSGESRQENIYISKIKVDGSAYQKVIRKNVSMLQVEGDNLFFKNYHESALLCYDLKNRQEKRIVDFTSGFYVHENVLYCFDNRYRKLKVIDLTDQSNFEIEKICDMPIIYDEYVYYIRSKSDSDEFKKNDHYYLCRKRLEVEAKEEILYSTDDYIFGYLVFDDFFVVSKGIVKKENDLWGGDVENRNNSHASLIKVEFVTSKEKVIRSDLAYMEIYNTTKRLYFTYEKWNGKRWDAYDSFLAADTL